MKRASYRTPALHAATAALLLGAALPCAAGSAADPMRPLPAPGVAASAPAAAAAPGRQASPAVAALPTLTAIREDAQGQRHVLVGDRWLASGQAFGTRRITAIGINHVELSDGRRHMRVYLLPPLQPAGVAGPPARQP